MKTWRSPRGTGVGGWEGRPVGPVGSGDGRAVGRGDGGRETVGTGLGTTVGTGEGAGDGAPVGKDMTCSPRQDTQTHTHRQR